MRIPVELKIAALAVTATGFYAWVGQLVPQKEVHPPEVVEIAADVTPEQMVEIGKKIFEGKGICITCHTLGRSGALRFPDLEGVGARAANRLPGMSDLEYFVQTLYEPNAYIVPGFIPGMPPANKPPVGLTDDEIKAVIAYLQSLGGEVTVTMDMDLHDLGGAAAAAPAVAAAPAPDETAPEPASGAEAE
jgi:mono/diheme cytochrome c family protein